MTKRYAQAENTPFTVLGAEATVITPHDSRLHLLSSVATRIWELCEAPGRTLDALVEALVDEFDVSEAQARTEVAAFVDDGVARGFLRADDVP